MYALLASLPSSFMKDYAIPVVLLHYSDKHLNKHVSRSVMQVKSNKMEFALILVLIILSFMKRSV